MTQIDTDCGRGCGANKAILIAIALAAATLCVFLPTLWNGFVSLDDDLYVTNNRHVMQGLSWSGITWAFTSFHSANWHPVTWLSHMLDVSIFGMRAAGHHFTSLVFHTCNALLLFGFLRYTTKRLWASAFVAAIFALHPLHVESVAWVSERKDVLSMFFMLATMWAYTAYAKKPGWFGYVGAVILYAMGLMSKPMLVTLPLVLLLLDYWPLGRIRGWEPQKVCRLVLEKVPFAAMAAADAVITVMAQSKVSAIAGLGELDVASRLTNAAVSYWRYAWKMLWPVNLAAYYPLDYRPLYAQAAAAMVVLVVLTVLVLAFGRRYRFLPTGWFWYLVTLVPVLGIVQVGRQSHADRYTYIPLTGLFIIIAWAAGELAAARPAMRRVLAIAAALVLTTAGAMTWRAVGFWRNDIVLYSRGVSVTKNNYFMLTSLAISLSYEGRTDEALARAQESLKIRPTFGRTHTIMGSLLQDKGRVKEALDYCKRGAELEPDSKDSQFNLALAYMRLGMTKEAEVYCRKAITLDAEWPTGYDLLGLVLASEGKLDEAEASLRKAISLDPANAEAYGKLAFVLGKAGRKEEAIGELKKALAIDPANERVRAMLGELSADQK